MKVQRIRRIAPRLLAALALAAGVAACDNPVGSDDHADPVAVVVQDAASGQELARATSTSVTGSVSVSVGGTRDVRVLFVDEDEDVVAVGGEFSLQGTVANAGVVTFSKTAENAGRLTGVAPGTTSIVFDLMHGSHPDFTAEAIPVQVTQ